MCHSHPASSMGHQPVPYNEHENIAQGSLADFSLQISLVKHGFLSVNCIITISSQMLVQAVRPWEHMADIRSPIKHPGNVLCWKRHRAKNVIKDREDYNVPH